MTQTLAQESELKCVHRIHKHLICFRSERQLTTRRAHLDCPHLVGVWNVRDWLLHVTVPEKYGRALTGGYQLELIVNSLGHGEVCTVGDLAPVDSLVLLEIVGGN